MPRPRLCRRICAKPGTTCMKPSGGKKACNGRSIITLDEYEAIRLKDLLDMDQEGSAKAMEISQPTFHRLIHSARKKVADALVNGRMLLIEGGNYTMEDKRRTFRCGGCQHEWNLPYGTGRPEKCPLCGSDNIQRHPEDACNKGPGKGECRKSKCSQCGGSHCESPIKRDHIHE
jgi:uncharacterized protein